MINSNNYKEYQAYFDSFFGRSSEYYTKRLEWYFEGKKYSFNIYAFFFNGCWLFFRKMYKPFFLILLAFILLAIPIELLLVTGTINNSTYSDINILFCILLPTIIGCFSNNWYIKRSIRTVENAIKTADNSVNVNELLKKKGGTSTTAMIIFLIISILLNLVSTVIE